MPSGSVRWCMERPAGRANMLTKLALQLTFRFTRAHHPSFLVSSEAARSCWTLAQRSAGDGRFLPIAPELHCSLG